ncbi:MAG: 30S ribosome-binding factor RbfA [Planctomycetota bacterium]
MTTRRVERVAEQIRAEIARILAGDLNDPRLGFVSITRVAPSIDLRHAKVYFSCLDTKAEKSVFAALLSARFRIQGEVGRRLGTRYTPELVFISDHSIAEGQRITRLIDKLAGEREPKDPPEA